MRDDLTLAAALVAALILAIAVSCVLPVSVDEPDMATARDFSEYDDAGYGRGFGRSGAPLERLCAVDGCGGPLPDRGSQSKQPQR